MVRNKIIFESVLDDWTSDGNPRTSNVVAKNTRDDIYPCMLRIGIGVTDKGNDKHYIEWMPIDKYRALWKNFTGELFEMLDGRPEIRDFRCSRYMFVDVHMDLDSDKDDEVWCSLDDVQSVFDMNRLYYESDRNRAVFCVDVYMDANFRRTRSCITLVQQLFHYFSEEKAREAGSIFWINSMCAGECMAIGWNAFNMEQTYYGGKLATFCRGLIGMCETGEAGNTNVHCYCDVERLCKFNHRDEILKRFNKFDHSGNVLEKIRENVSLDKVKFSVVTLFNPNVGSGMIFPMRWVSYNSATDEIDDADLFCEWDVREAEKKCMDAAWQIKQSGSTCDAYVYNLGGRPFGLLYLNYDKTAIIDDTEYIVLLTSKYYYEEAHEDLDNACAIEMIDDMKSIGINYEEALKILKDADIEYVKD